MRMLSFLELGQPLAAAAMALTLGVIFVNGWTDAPNAIATAVGSGALSMRRAVVLAAVCNVCGILLMTCLNAAVAMTISDLVSFGTDRRAALLALTAALASIIIWAVAAWFFGIPTSESHALIASLTGAALALNGSLRGVSAAAWSRVLWGLVLSVALGAALGYLCNQILHRLFGGRGRSFFIRAQIFGAGAMAFMHGAQDGQKFLGVMLLAAFLSGGGGADGAIPVWLMMLCAAVMALGTAVGGGRIIRAVGVDMVRLTPERGFAADLGAALALLIATVLGLPTSTTHTKTTAVLGAGLERGKRAVDWGIVREIGVVWCLTFPGCTALGYIVTFLLLRI